MGNVVAGDLKEIRFNHPTLGSGVFYPKGGEDNTFDLGGFRNDDDASNNDGGGRFIQKKNRKNWSFEGVCTWDMNNTNEADVLNKIAESKDLADWTVEHSNETIWGAKGTVVGDIQMNGNAGTFTLKIMGAGKMKKITG